MPADFLTRRRDILRLALLASSNVAVGGPLLGLSGCAEPANVAPLPPIPLSAKSIDVHCHAFNARDLPIEGFVLHVVLEADPFADEQLGALVTFIALLLDSSARTADAEIAALQKHEPQPAVVASSGDFRAHARAAALAMQTTTPDERTAAVIRRMHDVLPRAPADLVQAPDDNPTGTAAGVNGTTPVAQQRRAAFLRGLAAMKPGESVPGFQPKQAGRRAAARLTSTSVAAITAEESGAVADSVADSVAKHAASQSGILYFA